MNNDIDPNKIIKVFSDCRGTCKTPIGCTCKEPLGVEEDHPRKISLKNLEPVFVKNQTATIDKQRLCSCGKNDGGLCGCKSKSACGTTGCCSGTNKLEVYNWLGNMPDVMLESKMVEVQFKNTRKSYYLNSNDIELYKGDVIAVEATPGHDIGEVTLTGKLVELQMKKTNFRGEVKRVYRIAKPNDLEKYEQAKSREHSTMLRAREVAEELQLDMKISDVEYQGDGNKAIFYYIADGRVDFRQLIKVYASEFRVKIEMKQIGARQEAGRVGGIGPCGRELCCSSSMSNFVSVSTSAARLQDIPLNPQKLAGQCGKLKCCLNFEVDTYVEAQKKLPSREIVLETKDASFFHFKTDILSGSMTYSTDKYFAANLVVLPKDRVHDIIRQNKRGEKPLNLIEQDTSVQNEAKSHDVLEQESITRFDKSSKKNDNNRRNKRRKNANQTERTQADRENAPKQLEKRDSVKKLEKTVSNKTQQPVDNGDRPAKKNNKPANRHKPINNRPPRNENTRENKPTKE